MSNDFRVNWDEEFYHVSTNGGTKWTDDLMVGGADPFTGFVPLTFQSEPGVAFDSSGHSFLSATTGNEIFDGFNLYENLDTQIEVAQGFNHGTYTSLLPTVIDTLQCKREFRRRWGVCLPRNARQASDHRGQRVRQPQQWDDLRLLHVFLFQFDRL